MSAPEGRPPRFGVDAAKLAELVAAELRAEAASRNPFDALRAWRQRLDTILRVVHDGVVVLDFTGAVVYVNDPACRLLDLDEPLTILGHDLDALFARRRATDPSGAPIELPGRAAFAGEERDEQLAELVAEGRAPRWASIRSAPMWDEERRALAVVLVLRDVTEARRAEDRLRLLADLGGVLGDALDPRDIAERTAELLATRFAPFAAIFVEDAGSSHVATRGIDAASAASAWWTSAGRPSLDTLEEVRAVSLADAALGDATWPAFASELGFRSGIAAPLSARGRVLGLVLLLSERACFDALDVETTRDLARRCALALDNAMLYRRSEHANQQLAETDRKKDLLLAILAHELRNPLTPMLTSVELLRERGTPQDFERLLPILERQTIHLARLVDDLLDVSRMTHADIELRREVLDVGSILARVRESYEPMLSERDHTFTLELPHEPVLVHADPLRLEQVFGNLVRNAVRYSEPGSRTIARVQVEGDRALIVVEDTGIGIEPHLLPHIFELFVQNHGDRQHGLGVGLYLARSLVERHGGSIRAESEGRGRGSRFTISLPRAGAASRERVMRATEEPPARALLGDALVVDDDADVASAIARMLERLGCEVRVAHDGAKALAMVRERAPSLVLLDIGMPGMSGYDVARALRTMGLAARVVALSGYAHESDRQRSKDAGIDLHLAKPVRMRVLAALVRGGEVTEE